MKPRFVFGKFGIFGNTADRLASGNPYQRASVAAYCSTEVVGIHLPRAPVPLSASSGPFIVSVGNGVPLDVLTP